MTREILFRGKHKDNGEWLIGYFIDWNTESKVSIISPDEPHICNDVISETVGQYTGLTDKSGMKIFEGDYCRLTKTGVLEYGIIKFFNGCFFLNRIPH